MLPPEIRTNLEALLHDDPVSGDAAFLSTLKSETGGATLENILAETAKLERLRALSLPAGLFAGVSRKRLLKCKRRIAIEDMTEIRRHPLQVRYTLLAAFCLIGLKPIWETPSLRQSPSIPERGWHWGPMVRPVMPLGGKTARICRFRPSIQADLRKNRMAHEPQWSGSGT